MREWWRGGVIYQVYPRSFQDSNGDGIGDLPGLLNRLEEASTSTRVQAQKLIMEHEMGELFKVIGLFKGEPWDAIGFTHGDRTDRL